MPNDGSGFFFKIQVPFGAKDFDLYTTSQKQSMNISRIISDKLPDGLLSYCKLHLIL